MSADHSHPPPSSSSSPSSSRFYRLWLVDNSFFEVPLAILLLIVTTLFAQAVNSSTQMQSSSSAQSLHSSSSLSDDSPLRNQVENTDIYLAKGMRGRIDCPLKSDPPHTLIVWIKENRPLAIGETKGRLKTNSQGSLLLRRTEASDQGVYACVAYSPLEMKHSSPLVHVYVKDLPYFTLTPKPFYQKQPTQVVHMPCIAHGDPLPTISWQKISGQFPVHARILQDAGNLTIARLTKEDEGLYQCLAVNLVASIVTTSLLLIEVTTQHGPTNVTVKTTAHTATISWYPAYDGGRPISHVICYRIYKKDQSSSYLRNRLNETQSLDVTWERFDVLSNDVNFVTLYNLVDDTSYQLFVLSNLLWSGRIISSPIVNAHTDKKLLQNGDPVTIAIPTNESTIRVDTVFPSHPHLPVRHPFPPSNVRVKQLPDGLLLSWTPPASSPVPIAYYCIEYQTVGQWVPLGDGVTRNVTHLWRTASRGVTYHFRVTSYGSESQPSRPSDIVVFNTGNPNEAKESGNVYGSNAVVTTVCVVVAVLLSIVAVYVAMRLIARVRATRNSRHPTTLRYENVKYCGPNHHERSPKTLVAKGPMDARNSLVASVLIEDVVSNSLNDHASNRLNLHGCCGHEHGMPMPSNDTSNHREVIQVEATV